MFTRTHRTHRIHRTHRTRLFAAAALAAAALTLTACGEGEGLHDEGAASAGSAFPSAPESSPQASGGASGSGEAGQAGWASGGSGEAAAGANGRKGSTGTTGTTGSTGSAGSTGATGSKDSASASTPCTGTSTRVTAAEVTRPLNHLLLTVTNTGTKNCDLVGYPAVRFGEAQSVPPAFEESKPQAVVTLAPGESGYASVLLSAADGSGSHGYTATSLQVFFNDGAGTARPALPAKGVYVDDSIGVSYWQATMEDALIW
ncbi:DUF4232 domain-containing protein [Streptomyces tagetis]|uniref:DUF4232 domain-containing protein n=1 Tax=Streptomyces tagetis TaxID=2820809 RepID=A0A941B7I9_9ACTN|nr:DUF4232 domain-containing protein [Streptomyces sp. RG38]MBQ0827503.1 DUF4232 domain-containing protein [Streptomyces sp. RG38]